jgi:murein endopeptidase
MSVSKVELTVTRVTQLTFAILLSSSIVQAAPPMSIGTPQSGALLHPIALDASKHINTRSGRNFGTQTLVDVVEQAMAHVHRSHPETPRLYIGDLSDHDGGHLGQHVSHQSGRDADISYFRDGPLHKEDRLVPTKPEELDLYRTWTLIVFLLDRSEVQAIYSDTALIKSLHEHARSIGHTEVELARWFGPKVGDPYSGSKLRHTKGHTTHFHLRVRGRHEHRSWADMKDRLDTNRWQALKTGTLKDKPATRKTSLSESASKTQITARRLSAPRFSSKRRRSPAANKARARAHRARLRARLRAAQARAKRRIQTGRMPLRDDSEATTDTGEQDLKTPSAPPKKPDDRLTRDGHRAPQSTYDIPLILRGSGV